MRRGDRVVAAAALLLAGCGGSPEIHERFQAERDLWNANRELARLSIRPDLVPDEAWTRLVARYEAIGAHVAANRPIEGDGPAARAARDLRSIASQALSRAALLALDVGDTARAEALYERIEVTFPDLPVSVAGGAMARAEFAEARGDLPTALADLRRASAAGLETDGERGFASHILALPLRIARLEAEVGGETSGAAAAAEAATFYRGYIERHAGTVTAVDARSRLVDLATDRRDWPTAVAEMRRLEGELRGLADPPQDPAQVRLGVAEVERLGLGQVAAGAATLESLVADYPKSPFAARALLALAQYHHGPEKDAVAALDALDRLDRGFPDETDVTAEGRFYRAQILEGQGRWAQALEQLRSLPLDFPLSEAALRAPLAIARHHAAAGDTAARNQALEAAENDLLGFLDRYPSERYALSARERLVEVYWALARPREAVDQMLLLAEALRGTERGALHLVSAAQVTETRLGDAAEAGRLFARAAAWYPATEIGRRAAAEATRLGGTPRP